MKAVKVIGEYLQELEHLENSFLLGDFFFKSLVGKIQRANLPKD